MGLLVMIAKKQEISISRLIRELAMDALEARAEKQRTQHNAQHAAR